ncbi:MAG: hypothetical protein IKD83_08045 [Firmicutes bacterium]|nr:hypothetical protein [Bacillota bacterium]
MYSLKKIITTIERIEKGYNTFLKIVKYVDKAMTFYPIVDGVLKKLNASHDN